MKKLYILYSLELINFYYYYYYYYDNVKRKCSLEDLNTPSKDWQADALPLGHKDVDRNVGWRPNLINGETF